MANFSSTGSDTFPIYHVLATKALTIVPGSTYTTSASAPAAIDATNLSITHTTTHASNRLIFTVASKWMKSDNQLFWNIAKSTAITTNLFPQSFIDWRSADQGGECVQFSAAISGSDSSTTYQWTHYNENNSTTVYSNYSEFSGHMSFKLEEVQYV